MNQNVQSKLTRGLTESMLLSAFENSLTATLFLSPDGRVLQANQAACQMVGCTHEQFLQLTRDDLVVPDELEEKIAADRQRYGKASGFITLRRYNGSHYKGWIESKLISEPGGRQYIRVTVIDKSVEEMLRQDIVTTEQGLNQVLNSGTMIMVVLSADGERKFISESAHVIFGYESNAELSDCFDGLLYHEDVEKTVDALKRVRSEKNILNFENRIICKDGSLVHVLWSYYLDESNGDIHAIGQDITQLKQTREAMNQSEARLRVYLERATDGMIVHDINGKVLDVNQQACTNLGYTRQEMLQMHVTDFEIDFTLESAQSVWRTIEPNIPQSVIGRQKRKDGSIFPVEIQFGCFDDDRGRIYLAFVRDITERVKVEQLKLENERQFRLMIENMPVGVIKHAANGDIIAGNKTALTLLGICESALADPEAKILGRSVIKENGEPMMPEEHPVHIAITTKQIVHEVVMGISRQAQKDLIWLRVTAEPILLEDGSLDCVVATLVDITAQFENNRQLAEINAKLARLNNELEHKTQELTEKNTELEQFAYMASHDLQEPLRMITGFMQLLEKKYAGVVDDKGRQYINYAVDGAKRMKALIRDLLQYSLAGVKETFVEPTNMNEVVAETLQAIGHTPEASQATIKIGELPVLKADRQGMMRVMQNLISNALKYRGERHPVIEISAVQKSSEWVIIVKDNGIGILPENKDNVFVIFNRLVTKAGYAGTGVGLAICKRIVESNKGKIWVDSTFGEGSAFCFSIPA